MDIYSIVSKSHEHFRDFFFLPSLEKYEKNNYNLDLLNIPQVCEDAVYMADGWKDAMLLKVDHYLTACKKSKIFIWSDVDIEFYESFIEDCVNALGAHDIAFQRGVNDEYCAGFFIAKSNKSTQKFFKYIKDNYANYDCDQSAINANIHKIKATFLPDKYFTVGFQHRIWAGQDFMIDNNITMCHANYTTGIKNKILLLSLAKIKNENINRQKTITNINTISKQNDIKVLKAYYGILHNVTEQIQQNIETNKSGKIIEFKLNHKPDQMNRSFIKSNTKKYFYIYDNNHKMITQPIPENYKIPIDDK